MFQRRATRRQRILITGASSGLGAGMAKAYAQSGHDLALCARRLDRLEQLRSELLRTPGIRVEIRQVDVTEPEAVERVFKDFDATFDGIDRVIVNAGVADGGPIGMGFSKGNLSIARTNFVGSLAQIEAAVEMFRNKNKGHLVLIASVAAVRSLPGTLATYSASKAALASLGSSLKADLAGSPIRVTTVYPGYIRTPLNDHYEKLPFEVDENSGVQAILRAIRAERSTAYAPVWPWAALACVIKHLPRPLFEPWARSNDLASGAAGPIRPADDPLSDRAPVRTVT